ncbi:hypothetical protein [Lichenifustis flavocetrariae]|uniref:Uncharacterized protein n=1 Tax=Lichenifustis flavocetrariae TaxID=2949735 RepID=A0AA41Z3M2_9HYPH|nr:hypothetical protein [Lichenifustis flavocetrariae]MCW6512442.1 hypothetical protein [Lichenifustis flavocetrariae]
MSRKWSPLGLHVPANQFFTVRSPAPVHLATILIDAGLFLSAPLSTDDTMAEKVKVPGGKTLPLFRKVIPLS